MSKSKTRDNASKLSAEDLAWAYELRREYGTRWKVIARELGVDDVKLCSAVHKATARGLAHHQKMG